MATRSVESAVELEAEDDRHPLLRARETAPKSLRKISQMRRLASIQPSYIPWCGYFHIIQKSHVFVFHDNIQYTKHDWRNRTYKIDFAALHPESSRWLGVKAMPESIKACGHLAPWDLRSADLSLGLRKGE